MGKIDAGEAADIAAEAVALIEHIRSSLTKDDDGVVRLDPVEGRKLIRHLLSLTKAVAFAVID